MHPPSNDQTPHRRRKRYKGTHPRRFDERYKELQGDKYPEMQQHIRSRGRTPAGSHVPVLMPEVMECLRPAQGEVVVDCTLGFGGHAAEFMKRIGPTGLLIGLDMDLDELQRTRDRLARIGPNVHTHYTNYAGISQALAAENKANCDIIFADIGVSSMQVDDPSRGISYKNPGPLDMRMDHRLKRTGAQLLATMDKRELSQALWELSDEPDHEKIAEFIVNQRQVLPIERTEDLVRLIFAAKNTTETAWRKQARFADLHPAARTFQALRIMVNDELGSLRALLRQAPSLLSPGGRLGIISFHSGEDRLVKLAFREGYAGGIWSATSVNVIRPTPSEVHSNPRSSSAKFRWAVKA